MKSCKIIAAAFALITAVSGAWGFSRASDEVMITGTIGCYGNEPFVFPGIMADGGQVYAICAEDEVKKNLLKEQGKKLEFTGQIEKYTDKKYGNLLLEKQKDGVFVLKQFREVQVENLPEAEQTVSKD